MADNPELFDESAAAKYVGMSVAFLQAGRCQGIVGNRTPPPPHLKLGRAVKYQRTDLDAWLAARRVDPADRSAERLALPSAPPNHERDVTIPKRARPTEAGANPKKGRRGHKAVRKAPRGRSPRSSGAAS